MFISAIIFWASVLIQVSDSRAGYLWFPSGCTALEEDTCMSVNADEYGVALKWTGQVLFSVIQLR